MQVFRYIIIRIRLNQSLALFYSVPTRSVQKITFS